MSFIYKKYETERGFIKGLVVDVLYLKINDVTHNSPLPTIWVRQLQLLLRNIGEK